MYIFIMEKCTSDNKVVVFADFNKLLPLVVLVRIVAFPYRIHNSYQDDGIAFECLQRVLKLCKGIMKCALNVLRVK